MKNELISRSQYIQAWSGTPCKAPIAIAGVGGAGCNLVLRHQTATHHMPSSFLYLAVNTDSARIARIHTMPAILLHADAVGVEALTPWLASCHRLYLLAGLGGGAGSSAAPVLLRLARDMGLHTVALVTMPFDWEGPRRRARAERALKCVRNHAHETVIVDNTKVVRHLAQDSTLDAAFDCIDTQVIRELDARM